MTQATCCCCFQISCQLLHQEHPGCLGSPGQDRRDRPVHRQLLVVQMSTSSVGRYPRIIECIAISHIGLAEDADDPQITRAVRGYVQILSALASRMVKFDLDADAQELVDNVQAFCVRLDSACSLGLGCPCCIAATICGASSGLLLMTFAASDSEPSVMSVMSRLWRM